MCVLVAMYVFRSEAVPIRLHMRLCIISGCGCMHRCMHICMHLPDFAHTHALPHKCSPALLMSELVSICVGVRVCVRVPACVRVRVHEHFVPAGLYAKVFPKEYM